MANYMAWQQFIQNDLGVVIPSASVEVRDEATGALATIYSGPTGGTLTNPFTAGVDGLARFYAPDGSYKITATSGSNTATYRHVPIGMSQYVDIGTDDGQLPLAENVIFRVNTTNATTINLTAGDARTHIRCTAGTAVTINLDQSTFLVRDEVRISRIGAGTVTLVADSSVTVNAKALAISPQYGCATLVCVAVDEYDLFGDLA